MKHKSYMVIQEESPGKLEQTVDGYLKEGWQCQGGVSWKPDNNPTGGEFLQAMVTDEDD